MPSADSDTRKQPNILVVMSDDHGPWAAHCLGTRELVTPAMDHLAATGATMTHACTPSPVCSPARACFFAGTLPSQHGIHDWINEYGDGVDHPGLTGQTTVAELLQAGGYHTALVGKWHCGDTRTPKPGFDHWLSYWDAQYPHRGEQHFSDNGSERIQHGHQTPLLCDHAIDYLRNKRDRDKPFFLFVGFVDTHSPFTDHPERLVDMYRECSFDDIPDEAVPERIEHVHRGLAADKPKQLEWLAQYYAAVSLIDESLGRLIDELEGQGERDNTLVVYTSDHGHMNGHHGLYCKGNATRPLNFLDESIHVPCLLSWPGEIPPGTVRDEPVDHCDLFHVVLDAAGKPLTDDEAEAINPPGESYLPLLKEGEDASGNWRDAQFCEYGPNRMIRTAKYKLIVRYPTPDGRDYSDEFFDLEADPRETTNAIGDPAYADTIADLRARLDAYFAQYEVADRSGLRVAEQAKHNGMQAWLMPAKK